MAATPVPTPAQPRGRLPRWACQTSLFQLREPAFWVYVLLLVGTGLLAVGQQRVPASDVPVGVGLVVAAAPALSGAAVRGKNFIILYLFYIINLFFGVSAGRL